MLLHAFPESAIWMWENLDKVAIDQVIDFTVEINGKINTDIEDNPESTEKPSIVNGKKVDKMEDKVIDVNDPDIRSQIDRVKAKHGLLK